MRASKEATQVPQKLLEIKRAHLKANVLQHLRGFDAFQRTLTVNKKPKEISYIIEFTEEPNEIEREETA